jgi:hypothetical protein
MADLLKVEKFLGAVDANVPLFNRDPGILKKLQNMRVKPGGYLEARGGYEELKPSGGTSADVDATGVLTGMHEHVQTHGTIIGCGNAGATFTTDMGHIASFFLFSNVDSPGGNPPSIGTNNVAHFFAFGSTGKFSRLLLELALGAGAGSGYSVVWEYSRASGTWGTLTGITEDFKTAGTKDLSWRMESDWAPYSVNNIYLYWVRCRVSVASAALATATVIDAQVVSDWPGRRMVFAGAAAPNSGAANGKLRFYGQTTGGVTNWSDSFVGATTLFSGNAPTYRFTTFQDRLLFVNGKENKRYNNDRAEDLGLESPADNGVTTLTHVNTVDGVNNYGIAATYDFAITYGYGPGGRWGESAELMSSTGPLAYAAGEKAVLTIAFAVLNWGQQERLYVYRTDDLANIPVSQRANAPMYRIAELPLTNALAIPTTYTDYTRQFPFPDVALDISPSTPPARVQFISSFRGRVLYAKNDEFPARGWWSKPGAGETVNMDEDYVDLSYLGGGGITGEAVAFDTWFLFSENGMLGVADLDEDIPNIFEVPGGVGSIAPDAVASGSGALIWLSSDGVYLMTQDGSIRRISDDQSSIFQKMTVKTHGRSRAEIYDGMYDVFLIDQDHNNVGTQYHWRFDLVSGNWHESSVPYPCLLVAQAPLGHADQGVSHPFFGNTAPTVAVHRPYVGEFTTTDSGTGFDCIADIHFGPPGFMKFSPRRFAGYYQADSGWGTPVISTPPAATYLFKTPPGFGTPTPKSATDYKAVIASMTERGSGSQDIQIRFKATTVAGGAVHNQRFIAAYLEGTKYQVHPTS